MVQTKLKIFIILSLLVIFTSPAHAVIRTYTATGLIGGTEGKLDNIDAADVRGNGTNIAIADGDTAIVIVPGDQAYFYSYDDDSAAAESSPNIIQPDANAGDGRWILVSTNIKGEVPVSKFKGAALDTLDEIVTAIGATEISLVADQDIALGAAITWPATLGLKTPLGASIDLAAYGLDLASCPKFEGTPGCFTYSGIGRVTGLKYAEPEWWGANTTPGTTDMTDETEYAYATLVSAGGGTLQLRGTYAIADLSFSANTSQYPITISGEGHQGAVIVPAAGHTSAAYLITLAGTDAAATQWITLKNLFINGGDARAKGILIQASNNCRVENVTIVSLDGEGFTAQRPYDLYCERLRVKSCGSSANTEPGITIEKDATTGTAGNAVFLTDCVSESNDYRQMEVTGCGNVLMNGGKMENNVVGAAYTAMYNIFYMDGGSVTFSNVAFSHCHYGDAFVITDVDGATPGSNAYSRVIFQGCFFYEMYSYDETNFDMDVIYYDAGDENSLFIADSCYFNLTSAGTGLGDDGYYIHISADAYAWNVRTSNLVFRDKTPITAQVYDERTSVAREVGHRSEHVIARFLTIGDNTTSGESVTISGGAITATTSFHKVAGQGAAADDLDTITAGGARVGTILALRPSNTAITITVKDGTGNLNLDDDFIMDSGEDTLTLMCVDGVNWYEISRSDNDESDGKTAIGIYDFALDGGTIGDIVVGNVPDNATIIRAYYEVITPFTSGGAATVAWGVATDDATGLLTATAFDNAAYAAGYHDFDPDGTATNFTTKTTAARNVIMTIAGANLTAGKVYIWFEYMVSE